MHAAAEQLVATGPACKFAVAIGRGLVVNDVEVGHPYKPFRHALAGALPCSALGRSRRPNLYQ